MVGLLGVVGVVQNPLSVYFPRGLSPTKFQPNFSKNVKNLHAKFQLNNSEYRIYSIAKIVPNSRIALVGGKVGRAGRDGSKSTISVQSQKLDPNGGGLLWVVG